MLVKKIKYFILVTLKKLSDTYKLCHNRITFIYFFNTNILQKLKLKL